MAIGKKIFLIIISVILAITILFNLVYKIAGGTSCCSCCDDSQTTCITSCCRCSVMDKIEKIVKMFEKN